MGRKSCWVEIEFEIVKTPKLGELLTMEEFINCCKTGALIDDDGYGNYATATLVSDIIVRPSDHNNGKLKMQHTHVLWYNR